MCLDPDFPDIVKNTEFKPTLLAALKVDDNDKPDKLTENKTVKFPSAWQKLKECEINGQEFGAGYVAKRCKVELISCGIFKENTYVGYIEVRIGSNAESQSSNMLRSDIQPYLEGHGILQI